MFLVLLSCKKKCIKFVKYPSRIFLHFSFFHNFFLKSLFCLISSIFISLVFFFFSVELLKVSYRWVESWRMKREVCVDFFFFISLDFEVGVESPLSAFKCLNTLQLFKFWYSIPLTSLLRPFVLLNDVNFLREFALLLSSQQMMTMLRFSDGGKFLVD